MISSHPIQAFESTLMTTREQHGQPRALQMARQPRREAAYRRLAIAILGLDVETLASELSQPRRQAA